MILRNAVVCIVMYFLARAAFAAEVKSAAASAACPQPAAEVEKCEAPNGSPSVAKNLLEAERALQRKKDEATVIEYRGQGHYIDGKRAAGFVIRTADDTYSPWLTVGGPPGGAGWTLIAYDEKTAKLCKDGVEKVLTLKGFELNDAEGLSLNLDGIDCDPSRDQSTSGKVSRLTSSLAGAGSKENAPQRKDFQTKVDPISGEVLFLQDGKVVWPNTRALELRAEIDAVRNKPGVRGLAWKNVPGLTEEDQADLTAVMKEKTEELEKLRENLGVWSWAQNETELKTELESASQSLPRSFEIFRDVCGRSPEVLARPPITAEELAKVRSIKTYEISRDDKTLKFRALEIDREIVLVDPFGGVISRTANAAAPSPQLPANWRGY